MVSFCYDTKTTNPRRSAQMEDSKVERFRQQAMMLKR